MTPAKTLQTTLFCTHQNSKGTLLAFWFGNLNICIITECVITGLPDSWSPILETFLTPCWFTAQQISTAVFLPEDLLNYHLNMVTEVIAASILLSKASKVLGSTCWQGRETDFTGYILGLIILAKHFGIGNGFFSEFCPKCATHIPNKKSGHFKTWCCASICVIQIHR